MGISLDGRSKTPVLLITCSMSAQFKKNTSLQAGTQSRKVIMRVKMKARKGITKYFLMAKSIPTQAYDYIIVK